MFSPLKWQYIANKLNTLKKIIFKHPKTEYPSHGTMTENWMEKKNAEKTKLVMRYVTFICIMVTVVAPMPYARKAQLIRPQKTPHGSEFNQIEALGNTIHIKKTNKKKEECKK